MSAELDLKIVINLQLAKQIITATNNRVRRNIWYYKKDLEMSPKKLERYHRYLAMKHEFVDVIEPIPGDPDNVYLILPRSHMFFAFESYNIEPTCRKRKDFSPLNIADFVNLSQPKSSRPYLVSFPTTSIPSRGRAQRDWFEPLSSPISSSPEQSEEEEISFPSEPAEIPPDAAERLRNVFALNKPPSNGVPLYGVAISSQPPSPIVSPPIKLDQPSDPVEQLAPYDNIIPPIFLPDGSGLGPIKSKRPTTCAGRKAIKFRHRTPNIPTG